MVVCCKKGNIQSMSDSNIVFQKTREKLPRELGNNCKECCTFSSQYNASKVPKVPCMRNFKEVRPPCNIPHKCANKPQPCTCPPCSYPPYPYPPQDDLWDLQFCRWWGWNWVRKRDEIVNNQKKSYCTKREKSPKRTTKKHKNPKQDDFFSWCNKLFKGRQKECPLKTEEKQQLQDMYDTPSLVTISKCCQSSLPNWDCRSVNLQKRNKCYCNSGRQTSMSTMCIKNKTRHNVEKVNRRRHQSLCERGESTSSEEHCPRVYYCPKTPLSSAEESVEYLALRMECLNSDNEVNCRRYQKRLNCCQPQVCPAQTENRCTKNACPYKLKAVCERKVDTEPCRKHLTECNKIDDPYNGQFSEWTCKCGRHCTCLKDTPVRYPQFSKLYQKNNCIPKLDQMETRTTKEYIIHCPVVHCKKQKHYCTCCSNYKPVGCACKYNKCKVMIDKSVSCPNIIKNQYQTIPQSEHTTQRYKIALNSFQDSMGTGFKNGQFSSPVSGKLYELNPRVICETSIPNHSNFFNPIDVNQTFLSFYNDSSETSSVDKEHHSILAAVCEAIMSSRLSDQGSDKVIEEEVSDYDYLFMDNYSDFINPLNNGNHNFTNKAEKYTQKPIQCTDRFIGSYGKNGKTYGTVPFKSIKRAGITGSRIPLLKRKLNESTFIDHGNTHKLVKGCYSEIISNDASNFNSPSINKKIRTDLSSCQIEENSQKSDKRLNTSDNLNTNTVSFKYPRSLIRSPKLPGISINGLFSAISNSFTKNHLDKNNKKNINSGLTNRDIDSITLNSLNSNLTSQSGTSLTEPFLYSSLQKSSPNNEINQGLHEDNFLDKNKLGIETLHKYVVHDTTQNFQVDPMNDVNASSHLDSFSDDIDLNFYNSTHSNIKSDVNPNNIFNFMYDSNYLENVFKSNTISYQNTQNYLSSVDTEGRKHENLTILNILQNQQPFRDNTENELFQSLFEHERLGHSGYTNKSKDQTTNTVIRKSRIPIQDVEVKDCHRLLPIIEEHNVQATHTEANSETDAIACSKIGQN